MLLGMSRMPSQGGVVLLSIRDKRAKAALRGRLRDMVGHHFNVRFTAEPDLDDKNRWECPLELMTLHPTYGWMPVEDEQPTVLRVWDSQLGQLKKDFDEELPWVQPYVYRLTASLVTFNSGKTGVRLGVKARYDMGQHTLTDALDQDQETGPPKPAEVAHEAPAVGTSTPKVRPGVDGVDGDASSSERGQPGAGGEPETADAVVGPMAGQQQATQPPATPCSHENVKFAPGLGHVPKGFYCKDCGERVG